MTPQELVDRREELRLTRAELARILGISRSTLHRWEAGDTAIPPYLELALAYVRHNRRRR